MKVSVMSPESSEAETFMLVSPTTVMLPELSSISTRGPASAEPDTSPEWLLMLTPPERAAAMMLPESSAMLTGPVSPRTVTSPDASWTVACAPAGMTARASKPQDPYGNGQRELTDTPDPADVQVTLERTRE